MHGSYNIKRLVLNCKMLLFDVIGPGKLFHDDDDDDDDSDFDPHQKGTFWWL